MNELQLARRCEQSSCLARETIVSGSRALISLQFVSIAAVIARPPDERCRILVARPSAERALNSFPILSVVNDIDFALQLIFPFSHRRLNIHKQFV